MLLRLKRTKRGVLLHRHDEEVAHLEVGLEDLEFAREAHITGHDHADLLGKHQSRLAKIPFRLNQHHLRPAEVHLRLFPVGSCRRPHLDPRVDDPKILTGAIELSLCHIDPVLRSKHGHVLKGDP